MWSISFVGLAFAFFCGGDDVSPVGLLIRDPVDFRLRSKNFVMRLVLPLAAFPVVFTMVLRQYYVYGTADVETEQGFFWLSVSKLWGFKVPI